MNSFSQNEPSHEENSSNAEYMGSKSVVLHGWMGANETGACFTNLLALSSWVTEGNSWHVDVRVGILPDEIKAASDTAARIIAAGT